MIEEFEVKKEIFERLPHGLIHFEITFDGKNYEGLYRNGDVNWFNPIPKSDEHDTDIDAVEKAVHKRLHDYLN